MRLTLLALLVVGSFAACNRSQTPGTPNSPTSAFNALLLQYFNIRKPQLLPPAPGLRLAGRKALVINVTSGKIHRFHDSRLKEIAPHLARTPKSVGLVLLYTLERDRQAYYSYHNWRIGRMREQGFGSRVTVWAIAHPEKKLVRVWSRWFAPPTQITVFNRKQTPGHLARVDARVPSDLLATVVLKLYRESEAPPPARFTLCGRPVSLKAESVSVSCPEPICYKPCDLSRLRWVSGLRKLTVRGFVKLVGTRQLAFLPLLSDLTLQTRFIADLSWITSIPILRRLSLVDLPGFIKLDVIRQLDRLESIRLSGMRPKSLGHVAFLPRMRQMQLQNIRMQDWDTLGRLKRLKQLTIIGGNLDDPELIGLIKRLRQLTIDAPLKTIRGFERLTELRLLRLKNNKLTDLSPLAGLTKLQRLELTNGPLRSLKRLAALKSLRYLDLRGTELNDLSGLKELLALRFLALGKVKQGWSNLAALSQLEVLIANAEGLTDLGPLTSLLRLEALSLKGLPLQDLTGLARLTALRWLDIGDKSRFDTTPLAERSKLSWGSPPPSWFRKRFSGTLR